VTPSLFELPLRIGDAAALAAILIECAGAEAGPVSPDVRTRVGARLRAVRFECMRPLPVSLERDPVHPSALYICVDGLDGQPLLLRAAPASTPSSGLFPNAILIGRTRAGAAEVVLNAMPFGPADHDSIRTFSEHVNRAFLPRHSGSRPVIRVTSDSPADAFPAAFAEFRKILRTTGHNRTAFAARDGQGPHEFYFALVWSAIRSGWRDGYALESAGTPLLVSRDVTMNRDSSGAWIWL
jgi:hypothetical protein